MLGIIDSSGYEHGNRIYSIQGLTPTLSARDYKDPIKIVDMKRGRNIIAESRAEQSRAEQSRAEQLDCRVIGCMDNKADHTFESANRVYDNNALCPTIPTSCGGGHTPKVITRI